jgi:hypothetical protein
MHWPGGVLGVPSAGAAFGGNLKPSWSPPRVGTARIMAWGRVVDLLEDSESNHCGRWTHDAALHHRRGGGQPGQCLVAIAWQQQALKVAAEAAALGQARGQGVEPLGVVLQRAGRRRARTAGCSLVAVGS